MKNLDYLRQGYIEWNLNNPKDQVDWEEWIDEHTHNNTNTKTMSLIKTYTFRNINSPLIEVIIQTHGDFKSAIAKLAGVVIDKNAFRIIK